MNPARIDIYDTTLRDGTQGEGVSLSVQDKLLIARKLDELGVDFIEGGYPLSNPKDATFFQEAKSAGGLQLNHAKLVAFGMTRRKGVKPQDDVGLNALRDAETSHVIIVGKTWDLHATEVLGVSLQENLDMIADSVAYLAGLGRTVFYDAEHFFDGTAANQDYALKTIAAAAHAGAKVICLCDTNGGSLPDRIAQFVQLAKQKVGAESAVGIHPHNDSGVAVANALAAVRAGTTHVQGTMNGIGERCGNVDLTTVIANLSLKMGYSVLSPSSLTLQAAGLKPQPSGLPHLTDASRYVYEIANLNPQNGQPYVGASAFAHKGGMHVHAVNKFANSYEHVPPESVGNTRRILVSELSGMSNIAAKVGKKFAIASDRPAQKRVLEEITRLEADGYHFEAAEASFELIVRKVIGRHRKFFDLDHYRVAVNRNHDAAPITKTTLTLHVAGKEVNASAEGDGPINALDNALRIALIPHYPDLENLRLVDYKVRVVNFAQATAAKVRVITEFRSTHGAGTVFGTVGVSENVIDASWQALVDGIEYHLLHDEETTTK